MPEDEAQPQENAQKAEKESGGGLFAGTRGVILVVVIVILEAVFFLILLNLPSGKGVPTGDDGGTDIVREPLDMLNKYQIELSKLNYSIPTQGGTGATLSMDLTIFLGYTQKELQRTDFKIEDEDWEKFNGAVKLLIPDIKSALVKHIQQQTYNQLNSAIGKETIETFVMQYVNSRLETIRFDDMDAKIDPKRVTKVRIVQFYLQ